MSTTISLAEKLTNDLNRRTFNSNGSTLIDGGNVIDYFYYEEGDSRSVASETMGKYEVGTERTLRGQALTTPIIQKDKYVYNYITIDQAKKQAEAIDRECIYVKSELISSYAWDTALNYICQTKS